MDSRAYTFVREFSNDATCDAVVVVVGASGSTTVDVSSVFAESTPLRDAYMNNTATVSGGTVTFVAASQGVILIERTQMGDCPPKLLMLPMIGMTPPA